MERTREVNGIINRIMDLLPSILDPEVDDEYKANHFITDVTKEVILNASESKIEALADLFDQLYGYGFGSATTGYYDPIEDEKNNEVDIYTGLYYLTIV